MVLPGEHNQQTSQMRRSSALGSKTASRVQQGALFSVDDGVLTSGLCLERRKSKTLEYSNMVLQGPAAWGVVGERKGPYQLAIPLEAIPSNDGPPQQLREAG